MSLAMAVLVSASCTAHIPPGRTAAVAPEPDLNEAVIAPPEAARNGTTTAEAEEGNRLLDELMNASVVSPETIRKVFGLDR
jgi:hypothetical protein